MWTRWQNSTNISVIRNLTANNHTQQLKCLTISSQLHWVLEVQKTPISGRKKSGMFLLVKDSLILGILPLCFKAFLHLVYFQPLAVITVHYYFQKKLTNWLKSKQFRELSGRISVSNFPCPWVQQARTKEIIYFLISFIYTVEKLVTVNNNAISRRLPLSHKFPGRCLKDRAEIINLRKMIFYQYLWAVLIKSNQRLNEDAN